MANAIPPQNYKSLKNTMFRDQINCDTSINFEKNHALNDAEEHHVQTYLLIVIKYSAFALAGKKVWNYIYMKWSTFKMYCFKPF